MNQKGFINILVVIGIIILAGAAGYFALVKKQEPIPQQITAEDETTNWKTYSNEKYGFKFKYPLDLIVFEDGPYNSQSGTQPNSLETVSVGQFVNIEIFNPGIVKNDYDWPERPCGEWSFSPDDKPLLSEPIIFADYKTLHVVTRTSSETSDYYCVNYPQNPLVISFDQTQENQVKKILSTFKFIKQVPPSAMILPVPSPKKKTLPTDYLKAEVIYVTLADLAGSPNIFLGKKVHVRGYLISTTKYYGPNPEFAITDHTNEQTRFKVTPWRVFEVPPPPPGSTYEQPLTMQNYLNRIVELTGFVRQTGPDGPSSFYLEVLSGEYGIVD